VLVEVAAPFGQPLPALSAFAVAALADPLGLGRGPLQVGPDLISLNLGDRPLQVRSRSRPLTMIQSPLLRELELAKGVPDVRTQGVGVGALGVPSATFTSYRADVAAKQLLEHHSFAGGDISV
jgi:hypothetical protein